MFCTPKLCSFLPRKSMEEKLPLSCNMPLALPSHCYFLKLLQEEADGLVCLTSPETTESRLPIAAPAASRWHVLGFSPCLPQHLLPWFEPSKVLELVLLKLFHLLFSTLPYDTRRQVISTKRKTHVLEQ